MRAVAASVSRAAIDELHQTTRSGRALDLERSAELAGQSADKAKPRCMLVRIPRVKSRPIILDFKQVCVLRL